MKKEYVNHLNRIKEDCKQWLLDIINEEYGYRFTADNVQEVLNTLKEMEIIEEFLESGDFQKILDEKEG